MTAPRRRLIYPPTPVLNQPQLQRLHDRLESETLSLRRWQTRLRRAFSEVEKRQKTIARIQKQCARMENQPHA